MVNGKPVDIPSYQVRPGYVVAIAEAARRMNVIQEAIASHGVRTPAWLSVNSSAFEGKILSAPRRDEVDTRIHESTIIEFYSR